MMQRKAAWPDVLLFLGPTCLGLVSFNVIPMLTSLWLSFHHWNLLGTPMWGLKIISPCCVMSGFG